MKYVTQEQMDEHLRSELERRMQKPGDICSMLKLEPVYADADKGEVTFTHKVQEIEANPAGNLHGGIISWLMDASMGMLSRCYTGYENTVTMDIHVSYLRAVHVGDEAVIKAFVTHAGRSVINLRSELYVNDRLAATADAIFFKTA
jgi:uncharacterized protein (TIGR00369 family)